VEDRSCGSEARKKEKWSEGCEKNDMHCYDNVGNGEEEETVRRGESQK
jgi:hypothetical protein